ncbi:unnamed protein product [Cyprideis torosa]|uniref:Large ribosomal subunit protein bL21m n=1 Tax=Cyprideis torosa TaxID=163714 RepID=A0A7R8ZP29_9CRUS|nr:unnamed protein product [Cyprideis torosa]CAG0897800.1 unnamed protein product [Cyprideis torosa]
MFLRQGLFVSSRVIKILKNTTATERINKITLCAGFRSYARDRNAQPQQDYLPNLEEENRELSNDVISKVNETLSAGPGRLFAIVFFAGKQHKVTVNDILLTFAEIPAPLGSRITLDKVLLVGSEDFTLLGTPVLSREQVRVEGTVIEHTVDAPKISYVASARCSHKFRYFYFYHIQKSSIRINDIKILKPLPEVLSS